MLLPPYDTFPVLRTERGITLRQVTTADLEDALEIARYNGRPAESIAHAQAMFDKIDLQYENGECISWGIADAETGKICGTCGYYRGFTNGAGEIGFILKEAYRGKGIMREAIAEICRFGREVAQMERIFAITGRTNSKARALLEALHFNEIKEVDGDMIEYELAPENE